MLRMDLQDPPQLEVSKSPVRWLTLLPTVLNNSHHAYVLGRSAATTELRPQVLRVLRPLQERKKRLLAPPLLFWGMLP